MYLSHENLLKGELKMNLRGFLSIKSGGSALWSLKAVLVLFCVGLQFNNVYCDTSYNCMRKDHIKRDRIWIWRHECFDMS